MPLPPNDSGSAPADLTTLCAFPTYDAAATFNVKSAPYNAVGNGIADDTVAIKAAITAAVAAGGGFVYFPTGTYAVCVQNDTHTVDLYQPIFDISPASGPLNLCFIGDGKTLSIIKGYMPSLGDPVTGWQSGGLLLLSRFIMFYTIPSGHNFSNLQFRSLTIDGQAGYTGDFTVEGSYKFTGVAVATGGTGYQVNDVLTVSNKDPVDGFPTETAKFTVSTVSGGVITGVTLTQAGRYNIVDLNTGFFQCTGGHGTGATFTATGRAATGDGWDVTHKAFLLFRGDDILIYECDVKNWRGEVIFGGSNQALSIVNTTVRSSNASSISIGADLLVSDTTIGGLTTDRVYNGTENFAFETGQKTVCRRVVTRAEGNGFVHLGVIGSTLLVDDCDLHKKLLLSETAHGVTIQNSRFYDCGIITSNLGLYPESSQGFHDFTITGNSCSNGTGLTINFFTGQNGVSDGLVISDNSLTLTSGVLNLIGGGIFQPGAVITDNALAGGATDFASDTDFSADVPLWSRTRGATASISYVINSSGSGDTLTRFPLADRTSLVGNTSPHFIEVDDTQIARYPDGFHTAFTLQSGRDYTLKKNVLWNAFGSDVAVTDGLTMQLNGSRKFAVVVLPLTTGTLTSTAVGGTFASLSFATVVQGTPPYSNQIQRSLTSGSGYSNLGSPHVGASFTANDLTLSISTDYYYRVVTTDGDTNTVTSNELHIRTGSLAVDLLTGLAAYYKCDESSGNLADATGNGHTLTNTNTGTFAAGKINNAFSVTDAVSDQYGTDSGHAIMSGSKTKVSFSGWFKRADHTVDKMFIGYGDDTNNYLVLLPYTDGHIYAYAGTNGDADIFDATDDGAWHHYVLVYDGTQGTAANRLAVYRDGVALTASGTSGTPASSYTVTGNFRVGKVSGGSANYIGSYDEIAVYDGVALDASQVAALYASGAGLSWPFSAVVAGTLSQTAVTATTASLSYGAVSAGLAPYSNQLRRSTVSGSGYSNVGSPQVGATVTYSDSGLAASTDYYYIVLTTDNASQTATSAELHVTTSAAPVTDVQPTRPTSAYMPSFPRIHGIVTKRPMAEKE